MPQPSCIPLLPPLPTDPPHPHRHETSHEHVAHVLLPTAAELASAELAGLDLHALASADLPQPYGGGSGGGDDDGEESSGSAAGDGAPSGAYLAAAAAERSLYTDALGGGDEGQLPFSPAVSSA